MTASSPARSGSSATERVDCLFCGPAPSRQLRLLSVPTDEGELVLRRCRDCGLVYQSPRYTQQKLRELLDEPYFEEGGYAGFHHARSYFDPAERDEKVLWSRDILADLEGFAKPGRLLEVGAAGGHFLLAARERGWDAEGVELSPYAASRGREVYGLTIHEGQLEEVGLPAAAFGVVYVNDLLEHVPDPIRFLAEVRRLLASGGILYAVVPTYVASIPTRLFAPAWRLRGAIRKLRGLPAGPAFLSEPYHIWEFTPRTLRLLFSRADYDVVSIKSTMPSIQLGTRSTLRGAGARMKLGFMRLYAHGVRAGLFWGERTRVVVRPRELR